MQCTLAPDQEGRMLEVLYGEADAAVARDWEAHIAACGACRQEWDELRQTRRRLGAWKLPEFGRIPARAYARPSPLWRLAAAAVLLFAAGSGLALGGIELRRDEHGFSLRFGRGSEERIARLLAEQDARHEERLQALAARMPQQAASASADPKAVLAEVQRLIHDSEARQADRMVALVADYRDRSEAQRRLDMARMAAGLSYLDGKAGQHMARNAELVGYMLGAANQPQR